MAKNDASTNDEATKAAAAAAAGKATDNTKTEAADKAAETIGAGQAGAAANVPNTEASKGAPGEAAQPSAQGAAQGNTKRRLVAIEVISRVDGFWRGDRQWTIAPQTVPLLELSNAQLLKIKEEPLLIVRDVYESDGER